MDRKKLSHEIYETIKLKRCSKEKLVCTIMFETGKTRRYIVEIINMLKGIEKIKEEKGELYAF